MTPFALSKLAMRSVQKIWSSGRRPLTAGGKCLSIRMISSAISSQLSTITSRRLFGRSTGKTGSKPFDGTFVERGAQLSDHVCCDTGLGPIVIREGAHIGPFSYLQGPLLIDKNAHVLPHSQIKSGTHLGRMCKVGGEVEATIIEPYSNKQHHGFLGHAYVGSWVNLGAGTSNSNLKNTYGAINAVYNDVKTPTGMQFLGCILGDYVKTAINCSFYTGKRVGAGSMLYGTITEDVPAFVNYARELRSETVITPEVIVTMQRRMFARRDVPHRDCDSALIQAAFDLTRPDRAGLETGPPAF